MKEEAEDINGMASRKCRVKVTLGTRSFAECQEPDHFYCPHAHRTVKGVFCTHRKWKSLAPENTWLPFFPVPVKPSAAFAS